MKVDTINATINFIEYKERAPLPTCDVPLLLLLKNGEIIDGEYVACDDFNDYCGRWVTGYVRGWQFLRQIDKNAYWGDNHGG